MVTAWFVAMWLGGIFKTFLKKVKVWNRLLRTVPKLVKNPKPPTPPDPNCSRCIYGAWLRWQRIRNVIVIRYVFCVDLGTAPLTELPKVPNFCQSQQKEEEPCSCVLEANSAEVANVTEVNSARVLATHPQAFLAGMAEADVYDLLIDSGASCCITHERTNFIEGIFQQPPQRLVLGGLANGLAIEGKGQVEWTVMMDDGMYRTFVIHAYYVPSGNRRLVSPQLVNQMGHDHCKFSIDGKDGVWTFANGQTKTGTLDAKPNLPIFHTTRGSALLDQFKDEPLYYRGSASELLRKPEGAPTMAFPPRITSTCKRSSSCCVKGLLVILGCKRLRQTGNILSVLRASTAKHDVGQHRPRPPLLSNRRRVR